MVDRISIDQALKDAGLKKKYVAEKLGVSYAYLSTYIKNSSEISVKNAMILCELTGKEMDDLDFGQEDN